LSVSPGERREWIEPKDVMLLIVDQCALAGLNQSSYYYELLGVTTEETLDLMRGIDRLYLKRPFSGAPRMTDWLRELGYRINHKRVERLIRVMGWQATLPEPHINRGHPESRICPYLLKNLTVGRLNQVCCADITYVAMRRGFLYLVAVSDWFNRYVLTLELSNTLEATFCVETLERAGVQISMDGRRRALDNVMVERLWRTVKYEDIYLRDYADGAEVRWGLGRYFRFYNTQRPHQGLGKRTPAEVHFG
jgi:putative transposase